MIKTLCYGFLILLFVCPFVGAEESRAIDDWDNVEGVTVQPESRVEQIKAYKKKLEEAEKKRLKEGWEQEGVTVQSEERVKHLNELEKQRREKEINEIKCTMCTMRCNIVRDAGQTTCTDSASGESDRSCKQKGDDFLKACLKNCDTCRVAKETSRPDASDRK